MILSHSTIAILSCIADMLSQLATAVPVSVLSLGDQSIFPPCVSDQPRSQVPTLCPYPGIHTRDTGREMDVVLSQLAAAMPVDVMPGPSDPSNHSLPQQPLHGCLFPGSGGFATMNRCVGDQGWAGGLCETACTCRYTSVARLWGSCNLGMCLVVVVCRSDRRACLAPSRV